MTSTLLKILAPLVLLGGGLAGARWLDATAPEVPAQQPEAAVPLVGVQRVERATRQLTVHGHGEVRAAREVTLVAEVAARVVELAPGFQEGGFVDADEVLVRLDPTDYELALARAEARVAQAGAALELEEAEADVARTDWERHGEGALPALVAREPQLARARADVLAAEAARDAAARDLARCTLRAPFAARIAARHVEVGGFVGVGAPIGRLLGSERAEVLLPLRQADLAFLRLGLDGPSGPVEATLWARVGGSMRQWTGRVDRTLAELGRDSRMVHAVVVVDAPYRGEAPLIPGLFVDVVLQGREVDGLAEIPRAALRDDDSVLLADAEDRLEIRPVEVLQRQAERVLVSAGLQDGERVLTTPLVTVVDGMPLRIAGEDAR